MAPEAGTATQTAREVGHIVPNPVARKKILLADDHHLILDALRAMMSADFDVAAVDNSEAFMDAAMSFQPDVAILDISMPGGDGLTTAKRVLERSPYLPIIFLSMYAEPLYIDQAAQVGAKGFLSKVAPAQEVLAAIHAVLEGENLLASPVQRESGPPISPAKNDLTTRQREVLRLIALGSSAKDIANQLNISVRTAEFHRAAIMQRLGLHSTAEMTRYAIFHKIA